MTDIKRFDFDTRIHHGVVYNGMVHLTGQVGTPGKSAADQMREVKGRDRQDAHPSCPDVA